MSPSRSDLRFSGELAASGEAHDRRLRAPRGILTAYLFLGLALVVAGWLFYRSERSRAIDQEQQRLEAVASLKARLLASWLVERKSDVAVSARGLSVTMRNLWREDRDPTEASTLVERLGFLCRAYGYRTAAILDPAGRVVLASPGGPAAGTLPVPTALLESSAGQLTRLDLDRGGPGSRWQFRLSSPLRPSDRDPPHGWLVLTMDPQRWLDDLLTRWPGPNSTAETLLVRAEGDDVLYIAGLRHMPRVEQALRVPLADQEAVAAQAAGGREGALVGIDYLREAVFAWSMPVEGTSWWLVAQIAQDEVMARFDRPFLTAAAVIALIAALSLGLGLLTYAEQRRRLEAGLVRANERFLALFDNAAEGVVVLDADSRILNANRRLLEMLARRREEVVGARWEDLLPEHERRRSPVAANIQAALRSGSLTVERRLARGDGGEIHVRVQDLRLPDGRFLSIVYDLTAADAEERRQSTAKRLTKIGAWEWDLRSGRSEWDREAYLIYGYDPTVDQPSQEAFLAVVHPEDRARIESEIAEALESEIVASIDYRVLRRDGSIRWLRSVADIERDAAGRARRISGAVQDITEERRAAEALEAARHALSESQKAEVIGRLAGGIAHDFNNLVGIILGYCEIAEMDLPEEHQTRAHVHEIAQAARRAGELTRRLLGFTRRQPLEKRAVDVAQLLTDVRKMLASILGETIELRIDAPADVGAVVADASQLGQAIVNLAVNARDAMPAGGTLAIAARAVAIDAALAGRHPQLEPGPGIEISVADSGSGMDEATLERCFEPFFTTKGLGAGTGLGLWSVRQTVEAARGAIEVESAPGSGTRFHLWFPAVAPPAEENDRTVSLSTRGRGERVLVVDDEPRLRDVASGVLVRAGYRVTEAETPERALEMVAAAAEPFDLLLTDIVMPRLDGRVLAQRAREKRPDLAVLFMTGYADLPPGGVPLEIPPEGLLDKPFSARELSHKVRAALDARAGAAGGRTD